MSVPSEKISGEKISGETSSTRPVSGNTPFPGTTPRPGNVLGRRAMPTFRHSESVKSRLPDAPAENLPAERDVISPPRPMPMPEPAPAAPVNPFSPELEQLLARLEANPSEFNFFNAVRILEAAHPHKPRVGTSLSPHDDFVRFGQEASLAFPVSTVSGFRAEGGKKPSRMLVNFFGLLGVNGAMPFYFTDFVRKRRSRGDRAINRFLDLFHHRMVSLFYRAWSQHQRAAGFDRPGEDRYATYIGSLFGMGMQSLKNRDAVPDVAKLAYSGLLACQARHAAGLASSIEGFFGVKAAIQQFVGRWIDLPAENVTRLGVSRSTGLLGQSVLLGSKTWDCQQKFRIILGPMNFSQYQRLLPGGQSMRRLIDWVRNYAGDALDWDVRFVLEKKQVPTPRLGMVGQLGWSTWLISKPQEADRGDLLLAGTPE